MGGDRPFVSVVIPLYNKARYIERAVRSVLGQSFPDFELLVVDDASRDDGPAIVESIADPRIRLVRRPGNGGQNAARNTGIAAARGEIIAFLDGDDAWDEEHLEALARMAARFPEAGLFATGYRTIFPRGLVQELSIVPDAPGETQTLLHDYFRRGRWAYFVWISALAIRRTVFDRLGVFQEKENIGGDVEMAARVALRYPIAYDSRILATYHADASGRENPRRNRALQAPPFARTLREARAGGVAPVGMLRDAEEFAAQLWLRYAGLAIDHRRRDEVKRVLRDELARSQTYRRRLPVYRLLAACLPMRLLGAMCRLRTSRYWPLRPGRLARHGIACRQCTGAPSR